MLLHYGIISRTALRMGLSAALLAGCGGDPSGPPEATQLVVARVAINPDSAVVNVSQAQSLSAKAFTTGSVEITGRAVTWASTNSGIATVDAGGTVTGIAPGKTSVTATIDGKVGTIPVRVREHQAHTIKISPDSASLFTGRTATFAVKAFKSDGAELTGRSVRWASSNAAAVSVTDAGVATAVAAGTAVLTATVDTISASVTVKVRDNPVKATSYANFKQVGLVPSSIPLPRTTGWGYHDLARAYGDFYGDGTLGMFTSTVEYSLDGPPETATRAVYRFWRRSGGTYVEDNTIVLPGGTPCIHSRKALVADFNQDGRPDVFVGCQGFDANPFPGERNQVFLSQADGRYALSDASPDVGFWHGVAAADLNGDHYPDIVAVGGAKRAVFLNDGTGKFTREMTERLPGDATWGFGGSLYFTVELVDVNEDGKVDLVMGGHEWDEGHGTSPTGVWLNPGNNQFGGVTPVVIPAVANEGVVVDFAVTGTGATRTLWVSRTSGGDGTFYQSAVMQRFRWSDKASAVVHNVRPAHWVPWIIPYTRNGTAYVGSDDLRTPMEAAVP